MEATFPSSLNPLYFDIRRNDINCIKGNFHCFIYVVQVVCQNLELPDLLNARLVCQQWYKVASPMVHKYGPRINFKSSKKLSTILKRIQRKRGNQSYLDVGDSRFILCHKLILKVKKTFDEYQKLIEKCAPTVTYLKMVGRHGENTDRTLRNWLLRMNQLETLEINCPVLYESTGIFHSDDSTKLQLRSVSFKNIGARGLLNASCLDDFFRRSQHLRRISLELDDVDYYDDLSSLRMPKNARFLPDHQAVANLNQEIILQSLENHGNLERVRTMTFSYILNSNVRSLRRLTTKGLKLKCFKVTCDSGGLGEDSGESFREYELMRFLEEQKPYLTKLILTPILIGGWAPFPNGMTSLDTLAIFIWRGMTRETGLGSSPSISFPNMFPNITRLVLKGSGIALCVSDFFAEGFPIAPCTTLKHLRLPPGIITRRAKNAKNFSKLFPNITSLDVRLPNNEFLHEIWTGWPELTDLKVVSVSLHDCPLTNPYHEMKNLLDHGFTGYEFDYDKYVQIQKGRDLLDLDDSEIEAMRENFKTKPSITDLKKLERLNLLFVSELDSWTGCENAWLVSDILIYGALSRMTQLQELTITEKLFKTHSKYEEHTSDLSLQAVQDLRETLVLTKIQIKSESNASSGVDDIYTTADASLEKVSMKNLLIGQPYDSFHVSSLWGADNLFSS